MDNNQMFDSNTTYGQQAPVQQPTLEEPMKLGEWVGTILLTMIPCVGLILLFVWAFSTTEKKNKQNYAKAMLIIMGCVVALYILIVVLLVALGFSALGALAAFS